MKKFLMFVSVFLLCLYLVACGDPAATVAPDTSGVLSTTGTPEPSSAPTAPESTGATQAPHVHAFGQWEVKTEASCTSAGEEMRVCDCGESETRAVAQRSHSFGSWVVQREPTCTANGTKTRSCDCGETQTSTIKAEEHTWVEIGREEPTPENPNRVVHYACENCDHIMTKDEKITGSLGLEYRVVTEGKLEVPSCEIIGVGTCKDTTITIPEYIAGYKVIGIAEFAFYGCRGITRVTLPNSVSGIGAYAFAECSKLQKVDMSSNLQIINNNAFVDCAKLYTIDLPAGLTYIGNDAFFNSGLKEIVIPESVTYVGDYAFNMCHDLLRVEIRASNYYLGEAAFIACSSLTEITVPGTNLVIRPYTFEHCERLKSIVFEEGVTKIEDSVFMNCTQLESVTIPVSVTYIDYLFGFCPKMRSIHYVGTMEQWEAIEKYARWWGDANYITVYCSDGQLDMHVAG